MLVVTVQALDELGHGLYLVATQLEVGDEGEVVCRGRHYRLIVPYQPERPYFARSLYGAKYPLRDRNLMSGRFALMSTLRQSPSVAVFVEAYPR